MRLVWMAVLAAPFLSGAAEPSVQVLTAAEIERIEGYWEIDPEHAPEDNIQRCDQSPLKIDISEDGATYRAEMVGIEDSAVESPILARLKLPDGALLIHIQYEGEERLDDQGQPVSWWLVSLNRNEFYWVRHDWMRDGGATVPRRRCESLIS